MLMMARKNSTYQLVGMLLQFNFDVKVSRTTEGDNIVDMLDVVSTRTGERNYVSVYGTLDGNKSLTLPTEQIKKDIGDLMTVINYHDGTVAMYRKKFFMENIGKLIKDGAVVKVGDAWEINPLAESSLFTSTIEGTDDNLVFTAWVHNDRLVYMIQRIEFNFKKNVL